jgi:magnesium transporter
MSSKKHPPVFFYKSERATKFMDMSHEERIEYIQSCTKAAKKDIAVHIPDADLVRVLEAVDPDEATDILQMLSKHRREKVLALLGDGIKSSLETLLEFDPETAAGLMTLDYIQVEFTDNIASVAKKFKEHEKRTGRPPVILVLKEARLAGFLPGHELGFAARHEKIGKYVKRMPSIKHTATHDEVVELFRSHPHAKVVVYNEDKAVLGIIYSDDVLKLIEDQPASSLYDFAGVSDEEAVTDRASKKVKYRYKWLIINLATAFLASFVVSQFEETISKYVLLAVYMPIVAGMGGNSATQTLAVMVRGISLRQISLGTAWKTLKSEVAAGALNGVINGILVALVVILKDNDWKIALILALAMIINLLVAAAFGTMVPLIMSKLKKDPASSATIFITTATDVLGFLAFLGLATIILG